MAKYVIAGIDDCPKYAKIELLADKVQLCLPEVQITKIVRSKKEWPEFLSWLNKNYGWCPEYHPIAWRELVDRGGRSTLIGDHSKFQELIRAYYKITLELSSEHLMQCAEDNVCYYAWKKSQDKLAHLISTNATKITIIGDRMTNLLQFLALIAVEGLDDQLDSYEIHIYCHEKNHSELHNLILQSSSDFASGLLRNVKVDDNLENALLNAQYIILNDLYPFHESRKSRSQWLTKRRLLYSEIGSFIREFANENSKIFIPTSYMISEKMVYFNPLNMDVLFIMESTEGKINPQNIYGLPEFNVQKAKADIAARLRISSTQIYNLIIWGYIGCSSFLDCTLGRIKSCKLDPMTMEDPEWHDQPLEDITWCPGLIDDTLAGNIPPISNPNQDYFQREKHGQSTSEMMAVFHSMQFLINGTDNKITQVTSVVIPSKGAYGIPEGLPFSFPITNRPRGCINVIETVNIDDMKRMKIEFEIRALLKDCQMLRIGRFSTLYAAYDLTELPELKNSIELRKRESIDHTSHKQFAKF